MVLYDQVSYRIVPHPIVCPDLYKPYAQPGRDPGGHNQPEDVKRLIGHLNVPNQVVPDLP